MTGPRLSARILRQHLFLLPLLAVPPILYGQRPKPLEWRSEQQATTTPCSEGDLAFASAPEQIALEKSYGVEPEHPGLQCESVAAAAFNGARVLRISRPSIVDDGQAYTLVQPKGASIPRLIPFSEGGRLFWGNEDDQHNRAAMNAMLQTSDAENFANTDWLAVSLAYLTLLGEEPTLLDSHYSAGPNQHFRSYTVPGLLSEVPALRRKHLLPTVDCNQFRCDVRFYYRTEPVDTLKMAKFEFSFVAGKIRLASGHVVDYAGQSRKKNAIE